MGNLRATSVQSFRPVGWKVEVLTIIVLIVLGICISAGAGPTGEVIGFKCPLPRSVAFSAWPPS
jgi:hypothetical protein